MKNKVLNYNVIFTPEPEGGFTVTVPSLPGCVTYGKTLKEAKAMAIDAIDAIIFTMRKHNLPIPPDDNSMIIAMSFPQKIYKAQRQKTYA
ncbi:MAG: type II toxin-antitoxin system HicB family antitoxin [Patescibacteria group bacterium]